MTAKIGGIVDSKENCLKLTTGSGTTANMEKGMANEILHRLVQSNVFLEYKPG